MTVPTITTLPDFPVRGEDPATFAQKANDSVAAYPTMVTQMNASIAQLNIEMPAASAASVAAIAAAAAAEAASNAEQWVSGQAYLTGDVVWSPINYLSYRANTNTSGTTDPSISANWVVLNGPGLSTGKAIAMAMIFGF
jgi:hypothetical protein